MKKALFLLLLILVLLYLSCDKKHTSSFEKTCGKINTISVIIDDQLWNGEVGDSIRNKFASPVIGLPQEEPLFTINQYPIRLLEGFMANSRNVIVIKKENNNGFEFIKNEFASPQNAFHISGKNIGAILSIIEDNSGHIIQKMRTTEILENQRLNDTSLLDIEKITQKFKISLHIPDSYKYALTDEKFVWLKREITSGNCSLLIYELPLTSLDKPEIISSIVRIRDSIGNSYIHGAAAGTQILTEDSYAPYLSSIKLKGKDAYETKGTWELKNDFMSGPFINYAIIDAGAGRVLVLEGFCYAPSKEKRDLMFELEAIIKSISFLK